MSQAPHRRTTSRDDSRTLDSTLNTLTDQLSRTTLAPQSHTIAERFPGSAAIQSWNAFNKPLPLPPGGIPPPLAFAEDPLYPGDGGQRRSHSSPNVPLYKQEVKPQASVPASLRPGNGRAGQVVGGRLSENDRRSPAWGHGAFPVPHIPYTTSSTAHWAQQVPPTPASTVLRPPTISIPPSQGYPPPTSVTRMPDPYLPPSHFVGGFEIAGYQSSSGPTPMQPARPLSLPNQHTLSSTSHVRPNSLPPKSVRLPSKVQQSGGATGGRSNQCSGITASGKRCTRPISSTASKGRKGNGGKKQDSAGAGPSKKNAQKGGGQERCHTGSAADPKPRPDSPKKKTPGITSGRTPASTSSTLQADKQERESGDDGRLMPISALDALDTLLRKRSFRRKPGAQRSGRGQPGRQDKGKGKFVKMDNIIEISSDDEDNDESDGRDLPEIDGDNDYDLIEDDELPRFCFQHTKQALSESGTFAGRNGKWVEYAEWISEELPTETRIQLRYQIAKPPSEKDESGYMYVHEIARKDRTGGIKTSGTTLLKLGRSIHPVARHGQWRSSCKSREPIVRGLFPAAPNATVSSNLRGTLAVREYGAAFHHRWERLVLIEAAGWAAVEAAVRGEEVGQRKKCKDCGKFHLELFEVDEGAYERWAKATVEKWQNLVEEYM